MVRGFVRLKEFVLDLVFPNECLGCGGVAEKILWCDTCEAALPFFPYLYCPGCGRRSPTGLACSPCRTKTGLTGLIVALPYASRLTREAILTLKYRGVSSYAEALARLIMERFSVQKPASLTFLPERTLIVPVPLARKRLKTRGFNQAELIARGLGRFWNVPVITNALVRVKETRPQTEIEDEKERRKNVSDAFALGTAADLPGKTVLLVDDVYTTGATLGECARLLRRAGVRAVWGVTVARG